MSEVVGANEAGTPKGYAKGGCSYNLSKGAVFGVGVQNGEDTPTGAPRAEKINRMYRMYRMKKKEDFPRRRGPRARVRRRNSTATPGVHLKR